MTGDISLTAGLTSSSGQKGGDVRISGGEGSSAHTEEGGDGGTLIFIGGEAKGEGENDNGGSIAIQGGLSYEGYGGSVDLSSGPSSKSSSGDIKLHTADAGREGSSK